jgi:DNA-binding CsgD family transcriptional regulator
MSGTDAHRRATELVGRGQECALIDGLLDAAMRGESGSLVLRGEAGIGKSALLGYAADHAEGMTRLSVTGVEDESELAFAGLHGLLWPVVGYLGALPSPQQGALAAALGLGPAEGSERFLISAGVLSLLAAAAEERPVLCLIDDAQWLDVASTDALLFTARRLDAEGVVLMFALRDDDRRHLDAPGQELALEPLETEQATALLDQVGREVASPVRERLLGEAAGNPLALLELPSALTDEQLAGRSGLPDAIPLTARLQSAFQRRVEGMPEDTRGALLLAAADGVGELQVLFEAIRELGLSGDAFDAAEQEGLVVISGEQLSFRHPLVRSAVYESAPFADRRRAHAALASACSAETQADRRVWHRAIATMTADEEIAAELEASAERSRMRGGHASAATAYERAAKLSPTDSARVSRLVDAAGSAFVAGQIERARSLVEQSLPTADRASRADLLALRGVIDGFGGSLADALLSLLEGIELSDDASSSLEMLLEACAMATSLADYDQLLELCRRAAEFSPATNHDRFTVALLSGMAAELEDDYDCGAALVTEASEIAERLVNPRCFIWLAASIGRAGSWGDGLPHAVRAVKLARERGYLATLPHALQAQASQLVGLSQFDLAYAVADEARQLALDLGFPWAAGWAVADLAYVDAVRGDEDLVRARLNELEQLTTSMSPAVPAGINRALGTLALGLGRPSEALDRLLASIALVRPQSSPMLVYGVPDAVEAAARAQRPEETAEHLARYAAWVERFPNPARRALLARCRALGDETNAEARFAEATRFIDALAPFERARTQLLYGEWLRRERRRIDARVPLRAALETFEQLHLSPWAERARSELRASGETARRRDASTRDQLTPQELRIADLAASGLTNAEIGEQLFLSPRTIDYHLRKVFTKLGIASRSDLARVSLAEPVGG